MNPWETLRAIAMGAVMLALSGGPLLAGGVAAPSGLAAAEEAGEPAAEIARLKDEVERLKGLLPDQAHAMKDVAYHFSNLWFAGQAHNWPLARFYLDETRSHLRWAVRIRPTRRTAAGDLDLGSILDGLDRSLLTRLRKGIEDQDLAAFAKAYTDTLAGCMACHLAAEKPYLRLRVPEAPEARLIEFSATVPGR